MVLTDEHRARIESAMERFGAKQNWSDVANEQFFKERNKVKKERRQLSGKLSEHEEQCLVVEWMRAKGLFFFSVPNGVNFNSRDSAASSRQMNYLKSEGLTPGAFDLVILTKPNGSTFNAVGLEMKSLSGVVSDKQKWFHEQARACGWHVLICKGHEDAINQLEAIYGNR